MTSLACYACTRGMDIATLSTGFAQTAIICHRCYNINVLCPDILRLASKRLAKSPALVGAVTGQKWPPRRSIKNHHICFNMGSLCSKSNSLSGGHTVLGTGTSGQDSGIINNSSRPSPSSAAAAAAEARLKAVRGNFLFFSLFSKSCPTRHNLGERTQIILTAGNWLRNLRPPNQQNQL